MKAIDVRPVGDHEVLVVWEDGERSLYSNVYLQLRCRCAQCVDEHTGEVLIQEQNIDDQAKIREILPVGNYAVRFRWSSGCQSGIYSFEYLRSIAPKG